MFAQFVKRGTRCGIQHDAPLTGRRAKWEVVGTLRLTEGTIVEGDGQVDKACRRAHLATAAPVRA